MIRTIPFSVCILSVWLSLFVVSRTNAQATQVSAELDTTTIALGDQTILHLRADVPDGRSVRFPDLTDTLTEKILIVESVPADTALAASGRRSITHRYVITSFDAGTHEIPSFPVTVGDSTYRTRTLPLQVEPVAIDTSQAIYDIKQPLDVSYTWVDWLRDNLTWIVLALAVAALATAGWRFLKNRKKTPAPAPVEVAPTLPPNELALGKLQALRDQKLWQQGATKAYYSELSDILREFLELQYRIPAPEQTTDEIISALTAGGLAESQKSRLRQVLALADLVKFARQQPLHTDNEHCMEQAINFVKETAV